MSPGVEAAELAGAYCDLGHKLDIKVALVEQRVTATERCQQEISVSIRDLERQLNTKLEAVMDKIDLYQTNADKKPSWMLSLFITGLVSVVTALVIFLVTR